MKLFIGLIIILTMNLANAENSGLEVLKRKEGYFLLDLQLDRLVTEIRVKNLLSYKEIIYKNHNVGSSLSIFALREGEYTLSEIVVPLFDLPSNLDLSERKNTKFTIQANKINYIGKVIVEKERGMDWVSVYLVNRLAEMLPKIQKNYAELIIKYPLVFSGSSQDDFLELISHSVEEKQ